MILMNRMNKKMNGLKAHFSFNDLEVDDAINGMPRAKYKSYKDYQYLVFHSIMGSNYSPIALNILYKTMY